MSTATTFKVFDKTPEKFTPWHEDDGVDSQIRSLPLFMNNHCTEILQMSELSQNMIVRENGFVDTVVSAYNHHHNLVIRPDDVWAAIMTQFSFYVNKNAEEFRTKFVNFEGKKELAVYIPGGLNTASYSLFVKLMTKKIDDNLVDSEVKQWILPNFSTTTDNDLVSIGVVFMASMKKYFNYKCCLTCGIPYITLEGSVEDWKNIHQRLEKLREYKLEVWYDMLKPILDQFVNAKEGKVELDFWQRIVDYHPGGSGPTYISGWITAFCVFDKDGNWQKLDSRKPNKETRQWLRIDTNDIPAGIVEVDVKIDDNGVEHESVMFAGHLGTEWNPDGVTIKPVIGWVMALKGPDEGK